MAKATHAIYFRLPAEQVRLIRKAAKLTGLPVNKFIRDAALKEAAEDLARNAEVEPAKA